MSRLFDDQGRYALTPEQRTCVRCQHVLVDEDETGLYYQVPVTEELPPDMVIPGFPPTLVFMDRVHECGDPAQPHELPETLTYSADGNAELEAERFTVPVPRFESIDRDGYHWPPLNWMPPSGSWTVIFEEPDEWPAPAAQDEPEDECMRLSYSGLAVERTPEPGLLQKLVDDGYGHMTAGDLYRTWRAGQFEPPDECDGADRPADWPEDG